jgi:hypothetical protein
VVFEFTLELSVLGFESVQVFLRISQSSGQVYYEFEICIQSGFVVGVISQCGLLVDVEHGIEVLLECLKAFVHVLVGNWI